MVQGATTTESYTYDKVGNRLSSLGGITYTVNNSNQLTSQTGVTYTYDNNGNTATKVDGAGTTTYTWNSQNQLTQVSLPGAATVTFKYDPFGRRAQKVSTSGTVNYLYDGSDVIEEIDSAGNLISKYAQGAAVDEPLSMLRGTASYFQADGLGSVTSLTDGTGAIANSYSYEAFGKLSASSGTLVNPFRYTARDFDSDTSLAYYRARYYDPTVGRFLNEDPARLRGGFNFYRYVNNNPAVLVDPTGQLVEVLCEPVQQKHLGLLFGARHCRLHVGYDDIDEIYERLGPNTLNREPFDPARPGYKVPLERPKGDKCKDFEKCVREKYLYYEKYPQNMADYDPFNSNSNAFLLEIVRSCGGEIHYSEFQFFHPLFWYHFYGQMPDK